MSGKHSKGQGDATPNEEQLNEIVNYWSLKVSTIALSREPSKRVYRPLTFCFVELGPIHGIGVTEE